MKRSQTLQDRILWELANNNGSWAQKRSNAENEDQAGRSSEKGKWHEFFLAGG
ncbi:MAG: hypothetical protein LUQ38_09995 [Methanotrichaceae archaeon]|nr:hypothetical protein [Methanotrichaceae archaeon]